MSAARGGPATPARGEAGAVLMFVLMAILLVGAVTLSVMQVLTADVTGGVEQLEADQVYNITQAGIHYAIGQLQLSNGYGYTGGTITLTDASMNTLGTATIKVNCIDTGASPNPNGCTGAYAAYRRIISTGALPVAGPARTIVAIVQGTVSGGGGYAVCGLQSLTAVGTIENDATDLISIQGDIASNGAITLTPPPAGGKVQVVGGPGFTGKVTAGGTIDCSIPGRCSAAGGLFPNQSGQVCSAPPLPTFSPGSTPISVSMGGTYTIDNHTGSTCTPASPCKYSDVSADNSTASSNCAPPIQGGSSPYAPWTTLVIHTSDTDASNITYVQMNTLALTYGSCARLQILGVGRVDLRIGAAHGTSLDVEKTALFGVDQNNVTVAASRLTVWVNSDGASSTAGCQDLPTTCATYFTHSGGGGTIISPNGPCQLDDMTLDDSGGPFTGALVCQSAILTGTTYVNEDASGLGTAYGNFNTLLSWKDQ